MISYTVVLEHEEDGRYSVYIPDSPSRLCINGQDQEASHDQHSRSPGLLLGGAKEAETADPKAAG